MRRTGSRGEGKGRQGAKVRSFAGLISVGSKLMLPEPAVGQTRRRWLGRLSGQLPQGGRDRHRGTGRGLGEKAAGPGDGAKRRRRERDPAAGRVVERRPLSSDTSVM